MNIKTIEYSLTRTTFAIKPKNVDRGRIAFSFSSLGLPKLDALEGGARGSFPESSLTLY